MTEVYAIDLTAGAPEMEAGKRWQWREAVGYVFPEQLLEAHRRGLTGPQCLVLWGLMAHCEWGNKCRVSGAQLGRELGLSGSRVSRILQSLLPLQVILLERWPGQQYPTIVLSPLLCWKGRPWHLAYARRQFLAAWQLRYADGLPLACAAGHSVPSPGMRVTGMGEPPGGGSAHPGAHPFTHYPPRYPVGSVC